MTDTRTETVVLNIPVSRQTLRDLLCTAVEGGSNYWADFRDCERTEDLDYIRVRVVEQEASRADTRRVNRYVRAEDLAKGLERLALASAEQPDAAAWPKHFPGAGKHLADALSENGDAATADVVLQMTVFGELVYG